MQCKNDKKTDSNTSSKIEASAVVTDTVLENREVLIDLPNDVKIPKTMVWISGGNFIQGAVQHDKMAMAHEKPAHKVAVDGFFIDIAEVTNTEFRKFIEETAYVTVAERTIDWE